MVSDQKFVPQVGNFSNQLHLQFFTTMATCSWSTATKGKRKHAKSLFHIPQNIKCVHTYFSPVALHQIHSLHVNITCYGFQNCKVRGVNVTVTQTLGCIDTVEETETEIDSKWNGFGNNGRQW